MKKNIGLILLLVIVFSSCGKQEVAKNEKDHFIDSLLAEMTIDEKIGQTVLYTSDWTSTGPTMRDSYKEDIKTGKVGAVFNAITTKYVRDLQRIAVEETRSGIPLIFGFDVIHGHRTIFPVPLGETASWDLEAIEQGARVAAIEASAEGLNWTFAPMVDIARDPRWGRIMEGAGEDPYLGSLVARARVRGFQGDDLSAPNTILACVKHYAAYGAAQAGREYHSVDMSERMLRSDYLPPFHAAIDEGVATVMTSFNDLDGVPATGNKFLLEKILRDEWGMPVLIWICRVLLLMTI
jgi:beta-glucosidase